MGATGPDAFDCLSFTVMIQREHYGVEMGLADIGAGEWNDPAKVKRWLSEHGERKHWRKTNAPKDGDIVLMARNRLPIHIGTWIVANGTGGVLHCGRPTGVIFQVRASLQRAGWGSVQFFERIHASCEVAA